MLNDDVVLTTVSDSRAPQAVGFGLIVGCHLERKSVVLDARPAVQAKTREADDRELFGRSDFGNRRVASKMRRGEPVISGHPPFAPVCEHPATWPRHRVAAPTEPAS